MIHKHKVKFKKIKYDRIFFALAVNSYIIFSVFKNSLSVKKLNFTQKSFSKQFDEKFYKIYPISTHNNSKKFPQNPKFSIFFPEFSPSFKIQIFLLKFLSVSQEFSNFTKIENYASNSNNIKKPHEKAAKYS